MQLISDKETGRSKGFGFVSFADERDARDALHDANGRLLDGATIRVNFAHGPPGPPMGGSGGGGGPPHLGRGRGRCAHAALRAASCTGQGGFGGGRRGACPLGASRRGLPGADLWPASVQASLPSFWSLVLLTMHRAYCFARLYLHGRQSDSFSSSSSRSLLPK